MSEANKKRQFQQRLGLGAAAGVAVIAAGLWVFSGEGSDNQSRAEDLRKRRAMTDVINPPGMADDFLTETGTRLRALEGAVSRLEESNRRLSETVSRKDIELAAARDEINRTQDDAAAMLEDMAGMVATYQATPTSAPAPISPVPLGSAAGDPFARQGVVPGSVYAPGTTVPTTEIPLDPRSVQIISFEPSADRLETGVVQPAVFDPARGDYVPPNAYASARVLVGVDMSTGVRLSADPKPVLLRITSPAQSVMQGGAQIDVDLTGCLVNGAAHAELSSERVYVKLQKITCEKDGEVAESPVEGYIAQLGKVGVRGRVVSREGDIVSKALVAGVVGGFGRGIARNTDQVFGGGAAGSGVTTVIGQEPLSAGEIAAGGLGEGLATAADTVSDYLIDRAEQYQPVIEMPTGIDVEIVFLSGFYARGTDE